MRPPSEWLMTQNGEITVVTTARRRDTSGANAPSLSKRSSSDCLTNLSRGTMSSTRKGAPEQRVAESPSQHRCPLQQPHGSTDYNKQPSA